jgi:hypothetical protein
MIRRFNAPIALVLFCLCWTSIAVAQDDLSVFMMELTVKLQGKTSLGTGFMLMRVFKMQNGPKGSISGRILLITAAHVLEEIREDEVTVVMHVQVPSGDWVRHESKLPIRRNGRPLWIRHPEADVAVMYVEPDISPFRKAVTVDLLATDEKLEEYKMAPGVNLKCLGFPLGMESNSAGFAILRTGEIASYPLLPTARTKTFLMDFRVFKGNSGGPVYFSQPFRGGLSATMDSFIVGLISQESVFPIQASSPYETSIRELQLMLGVVVHASIIKQTIESLPLPESPEASGMSVRMRPPLQ